MPSAAPRPLSLPLVRPEPRVPAMIFALVSLHRVRFDAGHEIIAVPLQNSAPLRHVGLRSPFGQGVCLKERYLLYFAPLCRSRRCAPGRPRGANTSPEGGRGSACMAG